MPHASFLRPDLGSFCRLDELGHRGSALTVARVAEALGVSWNTGNDAVLAEGRRVLIEDPHRFDGVRGIA